MIEWAALLGAAFLAGGLNAVAGGGSFLTLPALVFAGVPALMANATGTVALLPGYVASTWAFREELAGLDRRQLGLTLALSLCGGALGAALLLHTPNSTFRRIVPCLLLLATVLFAVAPWLLARLSRDTGLQAGRGANASGVALVSIYGGYFNGGLGILLLALYAVLGERSLARANALKNLVSAVLTAVAVCLYAFGGAVVWGKALPMMLAAVAGGYIGARAGKRIPPALLRGLIVLTGLLMSVLFFVRG
ncbi:sulfite exporter TauE/SafE family protein [Niveibacterium sp. 24ML]|uniref:sulfite exporter TauE/SafE family protein n=1 Tax=Niveibacterium sp. 24ML TaxID=2985512 RepID=UPI00226DF70F|nr:sulfite exporter TauE/SafE family protein [Niveibacterium sp. 24ML]MCX9155270.1 sulfite exporter TauE/SafE family protein [Niveibacterium sp. 24ML]